MAEARYTTFMTAITPETITRIARLARIQLSDAERDDMAVELTAIVGFVEQLSAVDIEGVAPTDQVTGLRDVWREDVVTPSLPREQLLANAPEQKDGYFVVKRVLNG